MWVSKARWIALEKRMNLIEEKLLCEKYEVKKGDTLISISLCKYGIKEGYKAIAEINNLTCGEILSPGQVLWIPPLQRLKFVGFPESAL